MAYFCSPLRMFRQRGIALNYRLKCTLAPRRSNFGFSCHDKTDKRHSSKPDYPRAEPNLRPASLQNTNVANRRINPSNLSACNSSPAQITPLLEARRDKVSAPSESSFGCANTMRTLQQRIILISVVLSVICAIKVSS